MSGEGSDEPRGFPAVSSASALAMAFTHVRACGGNVPGRYVDGSHRGPEHVQCGED